MENIELEKSKQYSITETFDYVSHSVVSKIILKRTTGYIMAVSVDENQVFVGKTSPFDTFIQIVEGAAQVVVNPNSCSLQTGDCMIISAHMPYTINARIRFKMLLTVFKSGYEDVVL